MSSLAAALSGARSLRVVREPAFAPDAIEAIVIVGSTCSGKTTLVDAVRHAAIPGVCVPQRFVTRGPRADDVATEARYLSRPELDAAIAAGTIALRWSRTLDAQTELYAFATCPASTFPVYSANNAIYAAGNAQPAGVLDRALLIGVHAPDDLRAHRLHARSPELCDERPGEVRARLAESAESMLDHVHVVIENHGAFETAAPADLVALVRAVSSAGRRP